MAFKALNNRLINIFLINTSVRNASYFNFVASKPDSNLGLTNNLAFNILNL